MDFETLIYGCGTNIPAGSKGHIFIQSSAAFDTFPAPAAEGDKVWTGAFTFEVGAPQAFAKIPIIVDSGSVQDILVGSEPGSQGIANGLKFRIAGNKEDQLKFADTLVAHSGCICAVVAMKSGDTRIIGNPDTPAVVKAFEANSGEKQGDANNQTWELSCDLGVTAPILDPATVIPEL